MTEQDERRAKYPSNMEFSRLPPEWLPAYTEARAFAGEAARANGEGPNPDDLLAVLSRLGANASVRIDRFRGALLGLAVGDALGMPIEFCNRDSQHVTGMEAGGPFNLKIGEWTDDTSMALCLAYSLLEKRGFDAKHQMDCYSYWYRYGAFSSNGRCFDIGGTVRTAIEHYLHTGDPYAGSSHPHSAGNGSIMRLAPVVLYYFRDLESAVHHAELSSRTTHQAVEAVDACRYFAALLLGALNGEDKSVLLGERYTPIPGYWERYPLAPKIDDIARGAYKTKSRDQIKSTGYVAHTLEAALWCFHRHDTFRDGALEAVNLGEDSDTTGAVFGQLGGAYFRETGIPHEWIRVLTSAHGFYQLAEALERA